MQLSGLLAQVLWGDYDPSLTSRYVKTTRIFVYRRTVFYYIRYDEIEQLMSQRIIESNKTKTKEDWKKAVAHAHEVSVSLS